MRKRPGARSAASRRWWHWLLIGCGAIVLLSIAQVAALRFFDPPATTLMFIRQAEARWQDRPPPTRRYSWLPLHRMPDDFLRCVLAAEDQRFFQHHGFDWREVKIARQQAERTGRKPRGASTISMQCARSLFLWQGRSWVRKGLEAWYTFWMEILLSKRRILELYVNVIEMGDGVYGLEAAARAYYGVGAPALTREQCASLAAILPNPREWDPRTSTPRVAARREKILAQEKHLSLPALGRP